MVRKMTDTHMHLIPGVDAVMDFLRGVQPESLLDVGSGWDVFLFPFLREFSWVVVRRTFCPTGWRFSRQSPGAALKIPPPWSEIFASGKMEKAALMW